MLLFSTDKPSDWLSVIFDTLLDSAYRELRGPNGIPVVDENWAKN